AALALALLAELVALRVLAPARGRGRCARVGDRHLGRARSRRRTGHVGRPRGQKARPAAAGAGVFKDAAATTTAATEIASTATTATDRRPGAVTGATGSAGAQRTRGSRLGVHAARHAAGATRRLGAHTPTAARHVTI